MFRLIGIIVVIAVCIIAYSSLEKWYEGRATPAETVVNIRNQVGTALKSKQQETKNDNPETPPSASTQKNSGSQEGTHSEAFSTETAARELIKHANE